MHSEELMKFYFRKTADLMTLLEVCDLDALLKINEEMENYEFCKQIVEYKKIRTLTSALKMKFPGLNISDMHFTEEGKLCIVFENEELYKIKDIHDFYKEFITSITNA